jgi:hypothetical protein
MSNRQVDNSSGEIDNFRREILGSRWTIYNGDVGIINQCELGVLSKIPENMGMGPATARGPNQMDHCEVTISNGSHSISGI